MLTTDLTLDAWRDHEDRDAYQSLIADSLTTELTVDPDPATW